jgi:hypothetical protein
MAPAAPPGKPRCCLRAGGWQLSCIPAGSMFDLCEHLRLPGGAAGAMAATACCAYRPTFIRCVTPPDPLPPSPPPPASRVLMMTPSQMTRHHTMFAPRSGRPEGLPSAHYCADTSGGKWWEGGGKYLRPRGPPADTPLGCALSESG